MSEKNTKASSLDVSFQEIEELPEEIRITLALRWAESGGERDRQRARAMVKGLPTAKIHYGQPRMISETLKIAAMSLEPNEAESWAKELKKKLGGLQASRSAGPMDLGEGICAALMMSREATAIALAKESERMLGTLAIEVDKENGEKAFPEHMPVTMALKTNKPELALEWMKKDPRAQWINILKGKVNWGKGFSNWADESKQERAIERFGALIEAFPSEFAEAMQENDLESRLWLSKSQKVRDFLMRTMGAKAKEEWLSEAMSISAQNRAHHIKDLVVKAVSSKDEALIDEVWSRADWSKLSDALDGRYPIQTLAMECLVAGGESALKGFKKHCDEAEALQLMSAGTWVISEGAARKKGDMLAFLVARGDVELVIKARELFPAMDLSSAKALAKYTATRKTDSSGPIRAALESALFEEDINKSKAKMATRETAPKEEPARRRRL